MTVMAGKRRHIARAGAALAPALALALAAGGAAAQQAASQAAAAQQAASQAAAAEPHRGQHGPETHELYFGAVLFDQFELRSNGRGDPAFAWEGSAYYGTDYHRLWLNSRGETNPQAGGLERAELQILYSRLVGYYWDLQAGVRHDFQIRPEEGTPPRTYGVIGLQGLAPGYFEVNMQAFLGERSVALARLTASYDLLITNRLVLQPEVELNFAAAHDEEALISPGLYRMEAGLRLRYEITRGFAPYIGVSHERFAGGSAGLSRRNGEKPDLTTVVAGVRLFF